MNTPFGKGPSPLGGPPGLDRRWPPFVQNWRDHVAEAFESQSRAAQGTVITPSSGNLNLEGGRFDLEGSDTEFVVDSPPSDSPETPTPEIMLPALVVLGDQTDDGRIIKLVMPPWFDIVALMRRDPDAMYQFDWRKWEEIIAGAYKAAGFAFLRPRATTEGAT